MDSNGSGLCQVAALLNFLMSLVFHKGEEFLDQLRDYQFLKDYALCSYLVGQSVSQSVSQ
jgi:hypothetical protein